MRRIRNAAVGMGCVTLLLMTASCGFPWETVDQEATPGGCAVAKTQHGGALNPALLEVRLYDDCTLEDDARLLLRMDRKHAYAQLDLAGSNTLVVTTYNEVDEWLKVMFLFNMDNLPDDAFEISGDDMWKALDHTSADRGDSTVVQVGRLGAFGRNTWLVEVAWYCVDKTFPTDVPPEYGKITRISTEIVVANASDVRFWIASNRRAVGAITWESTLAVDTLSIVLPDTAGNFLIIGIPYQSHDAS